MPRSSVPKYQHFKPRDLAFVEIAGKRYYLGRYGSPESRQKYAALLAAPVPEKTAGDTVGAVVGLFLDYLQEPKDPRKPEVKRVSPGQYNNYRDAVRPLLAKFRNLPASEFSARKLETVRDAMAVSPAVANARVSRIRTVFKWGVKRELVPPAVLTSLESLDGLTSGPTGLDPVDDAIIEATLPHLPERVRLMVQLQRWTGMRPGEVCSLTGESISSDLKTYTPKSHKTAWRGKSRKIHFGPRSRQLLAGIIQPNKLFPYSTRTYRQAIERACKRAGIEHWAPSQLRKSAATEADARFGLVGAQVRLGHAKANITEVYVRRDESLAREIAETLG